MNTESLRNDVLVPAVAKTLDIAAKAKPTKDELCTTAKITAAVAVATAVVSLAVQAVLRNRSEKHKENDMALPVVFFYIYPVIPINMGISSIFC